MFYVLVIIKELKSNQTDQAKCYEKHKSELLGELSAYGGIPAAQEAASNAMHKERLSSLAAAGQQGMYEAVCSSESLT